MSIVGVRVTKEAGDLAAAAINKWHSLAVTADHIGNLIDGALSPLHRLPQFKERRYSAASLAPPLRFFRGASAFASTGARNFPV